MKVRRALTAVVIASGLVLGVAGCGGDGGDGKENTSSESSPAKDKGDGKQKEEPEAPADEQVLAEIQAADDVTVVINSAVRDEGDFLTVTGKVTNNGNGRWVARNWVGDETELRGNSSSLAGATLVDKVGKKRYFILRDTEGRCLCTRFPAGVKGGETATWYAQFPAPPESTSKVTFQIADVPATEIEISEGE
ncbi:hypothetical protein [Streptomyces mesophilus]|uniref:hypothetical protein n=1 Tax=Streptomyces mesophilus TaxID=1775132 RepID=UPI00331AEF00